jgi:bifunctional non-homologous end joining protein LigD
VTTRRRTGATSSDKAARPIVAGIPISHPDRPIFTDTRTSKLDLARYYDRVGEWILPHVQARPLTLVHCPQGAGAPCTYLRHAKAWGPSALRRVRISEKTKLGEYLVADSVSAVVALAQMGVVEIHTWNSTADDLERPNRIVWDLDPGPAVKRRQVVAGAMLLREVLKTLGLESWVKTTGGLGLHVVVPVRPALDWSECLTFSRDVSEAIVRTSRELYTTAFSRRGRERKILIDYLRNNRTNTSICAYSPRARPAGPVSVPVDWTELPGAMRPWTLTAVERRVARLEKDPWADYWRAAQRVSQQARAAVARL